VKFIAIEFYDFKILSMHRAVLVMHLVRLFRRLDLLNLNYSIKTIENQAFRDENYGL